MEIEWYPGHMTKAIRQMRADLSLVDLILEVRDARIPRSSANPDLKSLAGTKKTLIVFMKKDLADPEVTLLWEKALQKEGREFLFFSDREGKDPPLLLTRIDRAFDEKRKKDLARGIKGRPLRIMVVGVPNVGKSTLINRLTKKSGAKTGNRPGVTRGKQWIHLSGKLDLMDTPGVLWPKFTDPMTGVRLALTGAVEEKNLDRTHLALSLIRILRSSYPGRILERYGADEDRQDENILLSIGEKRGIGNMDQAASVLLKEFRSGTLGRISLEKPDT